MNGLDQQYYMRTSRHGPPSSLTNSSNNSNSNNNINNINNINNSNINNPNINNPNSNSPLIGHHQNNNQPQHHHHHHHHHQQQQQQTVLFDRVTSFFRSSSSSIDNSNSNNSNLNNNNNNNYNFSYTTPSSPYSNQQQQHSSTNYNNNNNSGGGGGGGGNNNTTTSTNMLQSPKGSTSNYTLSPHSSMNIAANKRYNGDCIVLSEFSEQTGPVALTVIPDQLPHYEGFDIAKYVVKIMSVDFQNKTNDLRTYTKDSQMFFTFSAPNEAHELYAYVHHFSLYDIYARGYVRPLVISYITKDPHKVIKFFDKFVQKFTRVINVLKQPNHLLFENEFSHRIRDLDYTLQHYQSLQQQQQQQQQRKDDEIDGEEEGEGEEGEIDNNKNKEREKEKERENHISFVIDSKSELKGIEVLFQEERKKDQQRHQHQHNINNTSTNGQTNNNMIKGMKRRHMEHLLGKIYYNETISLVGEPKLLDQLHKTTHLDKALRNVSDLCPDSFDLFIQKLKKCLEHFSQSAIQMEFDTLDNVHINPTTTLLSIGQTSMLNYHFNQQQQQQNEKKQHYHKSQMKDILKSSQSSKYNSSSRNLNNKHINQHNNNNNNSSSNNNNTSSYSSDSSSYVSVYSNNSLSEHFDQLSLSPSTTNLVGDDKSQYGNSTSSLPPLIPSPSDHTSINNPNSNNQSTSQGGGSTSLLNNFLKSVFTNNNNNNNNNPLNSSTSIQMQQLLQTSNGIIRKSTDQFKLESFSNYLWGVPRPSIGHGLLRLSARYHSWIRHAVYSLLKGRPLLIVGSHDKQAMIESILQSLSIFVVGQSREIGKELIEFKKPNQPLLLSDLSTLKLIGITKPAPTPANPNPSFKIPTNINCYISKIDLDSEEFTGPLYSQTAGIIDEMLAVKRPWNDNETLYTSHIQTHLYELSLKSFLYYHLCCAHPHSLSKLSHPYLSPSSPLYVNKSQQQTSQQQQQQQQQSSLQQQSPSPSSTASSYYSPGRSTSNNSTTQPNESKGNNSGTSILSLSTSNLPKPDEMYASPGSTFPTFLPFKSSVAIYGNNANTNNNINNTPKKRPTTSIPKTTRSLSESHLSPPTSPSIKPSPSAVDSTSVSSRNNNNDDQHHNDLLPSNGEGNTTPKSLNQTLPPNFALSSSVNVSSSSVGSGASPGGGGGGGANSSINNSVNTNTTHTSTTIGTMMSSSAGAKSGMAMSGSMGISGGGIHSPSQSPHQTIHGSHGMSRIICDPKQLFKRWDVNNAADQVIIEYLCEVVKDQQYYDYYQSKNHKMAPIIKLDFSSVSTIKNRR